MLAIPVLITLTDRIDPKRIYLLGVGLTAFGHLVLGMFATGFVCRTLTSVGWAGTYMTGLKLLADANDGLYGRAKDLTAKQVRRPALRFLAGRRSGSHSAPPDRPLPCRDCRPRPSRSPSCALDRPHN
ncbi:hypothetical protein BRAS3843_1260026 [Bradyrhizobium sp. STM 3843]|nr:hypothetical protein BRAS3843_1260026 [Bradyrhizobium sp. STM 3843]